MNTQDRKIVIKNLSEADKRDISTWKYSSEYSTFNYATEKNGWIDKYCCEKNAYCYGVKDNNELVGLFMFIQKYENEFRILINPSCLSQGYGKQITNEALRIGFEELNLEQISLIVRQNHPVAIKLYEKLGFEIVGETTQPLNGEQMNFYKMLKNKTPF
ncbi:MAG: GNAT family N-acetyltransferase [Helicobacteraceae bacterium]|nr:GNAT family N-acetyltransferase [Helicobacteraceae bacterium]